MRPFACLTLLPVLALLIPVAAQAQTRFEGAGEEVALDCNGGTIHVAGASNRLTIGGACTELQVEGANNQIRIDLAARSGISVQGAGNVIRWTAPGSAKPKLAISGAGNRLSRAR
ncbi:DUF3060 domain-containing protein [Sphingobium sufflavum]|uniref:DUF3060 domain-containing protein n=1 Tax=Sphingobium sufflavum TaxID=1129547 RepID=UPI001F18D061|nr:DUF3060 domain-containing protein [Sphingobium sufflavum]MCE7797640.1 DUF3060 domain-containing protein [Sphingobium sufflavum]